MSRPACYNRAPRQAEYLGQPSPFVDRCATWDGVGIGPNNERYPVAHGFDCRGCRWLPAEHEDEAYAQQPA